jgi:hypothetical protein
MAYFSVVPIPSPFHHPGGIGMKSQEEKLSPSQTHGVKSLKRAINTLGRRTIDKRTRVGKRHAHLRDTVIDALGGRAVLTPQKKLLVDEVILTKLMLDSVNHWIVAQPTIINKRQKSVIAAVRDRNGLVNILRALLQDLGLERHATLVPTLADYLSTKAKSDAEDSRTDTDSTDTNGMTTTT